MHLLAELVFCAERPRGLLRVGCTLVSTAEVVDCTMVPGHLNCRRRKRGKQLEGV
jgi:hypothetical protein